VYEMGMNINLHSRTIEEVLAMRKKQCNELLELVSTVRGSAGRGGQGCKMVAKHPGIFLPPAHWEGGGGA
jgi:hypothetical protein